ncbi:hypothetical protein MIDIC_310028 [Alphaproteobacteria bacterium]
MDNTNVHHRQYGKPKEQQVANNVKQSTSYTTEPDTSAQQIAMDQCSGELKRCYAMTRDKDDATITHSEELKYCHVAVHEKNSSLTRTTEKLQEYNSTIIALRNNYTEDLHRCNATINGKEDELAYTIQQLKKCYNMVEELPITADIENEFKNIKKQENEIQKNFTSSVKAFEVLCNTNTTCLENVISMQMAFLSGFKVLKAQILNLTKVAWEESHPNSWFKCLSSCYSNQKANCHNKVKKDNVLDVMEKYGLRDDILNVTNKTNAEQFTKDPAFYKYVVGFVARYCGDCDHKKILAIQKQQCESLKSDLDSVLSSHIVDSIEHYCEELAVPQTMMNYP